MIDEMMVDKHIYAIFLTILSVIFVLFECQFAVMLLVMFSHGMVFSPVYGRMSKSNNIYYAAKIYSIFSAVLFSLMYFGFLIQDYNNISGQLVAAGLIILVFPPFLYACSYYSFLFGSGAFLRK